MALIALAAQVWAASVEVNARTEFQQAALADGTIVQYIGDQNVANAALRAGPFDRFVGMQDSPTQRGYNTDGIREFDTKPGTGVHSLPLSQVPIVDVGGNRYWEFFASVVEPGAGESPKISLDAVELYLTSNPNLSGYDFGLTPIYELPEAVLMRAVNPGGVNEGDLRLLVPHQPASVPAGCEFGSSACATYVVLYSEWGFTAGYESNAGFESWMIRKYTGPAVSKTADAASVTSIEWDITKTASETDLELFAGASQSVTYTIDAEPTVGETSYSVTGEIVISGAPVSDVTVVEISDDFEGTPGVILDCPVPFVIAAGGSRTCAYALDPGGAVTGTNVANVTIEVSGSNVIFRAEAEVTSYDEVVEGAASVRVTDDNATPGDPSDDRPFGPFAPDAHDAVTYQTSFVCPIGQDSYAAGSLTATRTNSAAFDEIAGSDSATVNLACRAPVVTKTAAATFTETYSWSIDKGPDGTPTADAGSTASHQFTVEVDQTVSTGGHQVSGTISITNPHSTDSLVVEVDDVLDDGTVATVATCGGDPYVGTLSIPAGATVDCAYQVGGLDGDQTSNTATVSFDGLQFTATKPFSFVSDGQPSGATSVQVTDDNGTPGDASDDLSRGPFAGDDSFSYTTEYDCPADGYGEDGVLVLGPITNTASLVGAPGSATATATVTCTKEPVQSGAPDVTIDKDDGLTEVWSGQEVTYDIVVANIGTGPASNVVVTDQIPDGTEFVSCTSDAGGGDCALAGSTVEYGAFDLGVGESVTLTLTVRITATPGSGAAGGLQTITTDNLFTCAVRADATVACMGHNGSGQLGIGSTARSLVPATVVDPADNPVAGVVSVASGRDHACAVLGDGTVRCWGSGSYGQLGNDANTRQLNPVAVQGLSGPVIDLDAGWRHTCALIEGGAVQCWGSSDSGQVGDGTTTRRWTATTVPGIDAIDVAAGGDSSCAVLAGGGVRCWGWNGYGQLGNGVSSGSSTTPVPVTGISNAVRLGVGDSHACAVLDNGWVQCWGRNHVGQLGDNTTASRPVPGAVHSIGLVDAVVGGGDHTCARLQGSRGLQCWGDNGSGQLGDDSVTDRHLPVDVVGLADVASFDAGENHTCAVLADGSAWCWGNNTQGQFGLNDKVNRDVPTLIPDFVGAAVVGVGSGLTEIVNVAVATYDEGGPVSNDDINTLVEVPPSPDLRIEKSNSSDTVASGTETTYEIVVTNDDPARAATGVTVTDVLGEGLSFVSATDGGHETAVGSGIVIFPPFSLAAGESYSLFVTALVEAVPSAGAAGDTVAAGYQFTCAVRTDTGVDCMGHNGSGQLGDGTTARHLSPEPVVFAGGGNLSGAVSVAAGRDHACAILDDGSAWCWGNNGGGQLGDGTTSRRLNPVQVVGLAEAVQLATGKSHTCAIVGAAGAVECWGNNNNGQLGDGSLSRRTTPVPVPGVTDVVDIAAEEDTTCAVDSSGQVWCWGNNNTGQIGDGTTTRRTSPVASGVSDGRDVSVGYFHACAARDGGAISCWGRNNYGQLGDGTRTDRRSPVEVVSIGDATAVIAGGFHSCSRNAAGVMSCWGLNTSGQLGDDTTTTVYNPQAVVGGLAGVVSFTGGTYHTCAVTGAGELWCWGQNTQGQLGLGDKVNRDRPHLVGLYALPGGGPVTVVNEATAADDGSQGLDPTPENNATRDEDEVT